MRVDEGSFGFKLSTPRIVVRGDFFEGEHEHEPDDDGSEVRNKGINARVLNHKLKLFSRTAAGTYRHRITSSIFSWSWSQGKPAPPPFLLSDCKGVINNNL